MRAEKRGAQRQRGPQERQRRSCAWHISRNMFLRYKLGAMMLDYLDGLCAALLARNGTEIRRLLRHPLARALPRRVREEGYSIARSGPESLRAPVHTLHFYHQTLHLLGARTSAARAETPSSAERTGTDRQIEMPLRASGG